MQRRFELFRSRSVAKLGEFPESAAAMSLKSIAAPMALGFLSLVAVAVALATFDYQRTIEKHDFDGAFSQIQAAFIQHPEILNPAITAPVREGLRLAALNRLNLEHIDE
jgi:hypothetical protein